MEHPQETLETVPMKHEGFEENPSLLSEHLFRGVIAPIFHGQFSDSFQSY